MYTTIMSMRKQLGRRIVSQFMHPRGLTGADFLICTAGHVVSEQDRLTREGRWDALRQDLTTFVQERAEHTDGHLDLILDYLLVASAKV